MKNLVSEIELLTADVNKLKREIASLGSKIVYNAFDAAKKVLDFEPIYKRALKFGTPVEVRENYYRSDGELLKGVLILATVEFMGKVEDNEVEEFNELFLTEDGDLKSYYSVHQFPEGRKFSIQHEVTRFEANIDPGILYYHEIIQGIVERLRYRREELMEQKELLFECLRKIDTIPTDYISRGE
jgi:hypothetical protein